MPLHRYLIVCECGQKLMVKEVVSDLCSNSAKILVGPHKCTKRTPMPSIDTLVKENKETLEALHKKFLKWDNVEKHWMCTCPICRSLEKGGDCQKEGN